MIICTGDELVVIIVGKVGVVRVVVIHWESLERFYWGTWILYYPISLYVDLIKHISVREPTQGTYGSPNPSLIE
jgi:hypothetical protein